MCSVARGSNVGGKGGEGRHVGVIGGRRARGEGRDRLALLAGRSDDLVVHVRDVADVDHLAVAPLEEAVEHIEDDDRPRVADVGEVIDRGAAYVHAHALGLERSEGLLPAAERIVKRQRHDIPSPIQLPRIPNKCRSRGR